MILASAAVALGVGACADEGPVVVPTGRTSQAATTPPTPLPEPTAPVETTPPPTSGGQELPTPGGGQPGGTGGGEPGGPGGGEPTGPGGGGVPEPTGEEISEADWENVMAYVEAHLSDDFTGAEQYAEPNSPAMGYLFHQTAYQDAVAESEGWNLVPASVVGGDRLSRTVDATDDYGAFQYHDFEVGPSGRVSAFSSAAGPVAERLSISPGWPADDGGVHLSLISAYVNDALALVVVAGVSNFTDGPLQTPDPARYTNPDGTELVIDPGWWVGYEQIGHGGRSYMFYFPEGELGGTLSYNLVLPDGTSQVQTIDVPLMD